MKKLPATRLPAFAKLLTVALSATSIFCLQNCTALADSYNPGFTWQRSADWIVQPASDQGTTHGNPAPDALGNSVWSYEWVQGGGGLWTANPWYAQPSQKLVWDANWYTTGVPGWARADDAGNRVSQDYPPFIDQNQLTLNLGADLPISSPDQSPVVRWMNPLQQLTQLSIAGTLQVGWQGEDSGYPVDVDLVIAQESAGGVFDILFANTISKPHDDSTKEFLNVPVNTFASVKPGDSIIFSLRANGQSAGNWITLQDDPLTLTIVPEPSTGALVVLTVMLLWVRRSCGCSWSNVGALL